MVGCSVLYAFEQTLASLSILFLLIYIATYVIPMLCNISQLKVCDFIKGVIYTIYLSPTYINIFTIYAIANIHDVTWGSRPSVVTSQFATTEAKKNVLYKNYRSNFLVFWIVLNAVIGFVVVYLSRNGQVAIMFAIGTFLVLVNLVKLFFSLVHLVKAKINK